MFQNTNKVTFPSLTAQDVLVICNDTKGCNVPSISLGSQPTEKLQSNNLDESNGSGSDGVNILQDNKLINTLSIIATSPVLYIQRLRKRFEEGSNNRTKREKRDVSSDDKGKVHFEYSERTRNPLSENTNNRKNKVSASLENSKRKLSQEPIFYQERKLSQSKNNPHKHVHKGSVKRRKGKTLRPTNDGKSDKHTNSSKNLGSNTTSKNARLDTFDNDESNIDYIQTTRNDKGGSDHYSLFRNPVYDSSDDYDEEIILGGSKRQHDGTTPFPIVDADHDYDSEFEYVKLDDQGSREENESDKSNYSEPNEDDQSQQTYENNNGRDEENHEGGSTEDENEGSEEIVKYPPVVVVYKGSPKDAYTASQIDPNLDIHERYITKDPLAGPGATRGFNHDFKVMRGVPAQGGVVVQPNSRFPTVPGFNTSQIHNIIKIGRLPGVTGIGPNFTKVGIIPIEPARHATPNDFGEYLGLRGLYGNSEPVGRPQIMKHTPYHGRRPLHNGYPVKSQRVVLRRPGSYRQPIRLSSYPIRSQYHPYSYRPKNVLPKQLLRIKIIEDRASEVDPEENENSSEETSSENPVEGAKYDEWYNYNDDIEHDEEINDEREDQNEHLINKNHRDNIEPSHELEEGNGNKNSPLNKQNINIDMEHKAFTPTRSNVDKTEQKQIYRMNTPKIRKPKKSTKHIENIPQNNKNKVSQSDLSRHYNKAQSDTNYNQDELVKPNYDAQTDGNSSERDYTEQEEQSREAQDENRDIGSTSILREKPTEKDDKNEDTEDINISRENPTEKDDETDDVNSNEEENISNTLSKLIQRTEDLQNDKMMTNGEEPISYNNYWTLEYSLPNFR